MEKLVNSKKDIEQIILLHEKGYLNKEIATMMGVSASTIARRLQKTQVKSKHPLLTDDRKQEILNCYLKTLNRKEVCKIMHVSDSTLKKILEDNNIKTKDLSHAKQKYALNEYYFDFINNQNKAYIFGLLCADGCVDKPPRNGIHLSLQSQDVGILKKILFELDTNRPLRLISMSKTNPNHSDQYCIDIVNKYMHSALIQKGLVPNKSLVFKFPSNIPENLLPHFIRGYFDGDGCILKSECRVSMVCTKYFAEKAKCLFEDKLKIHCSISICGKKYKNSPMRDLRISGYHQVKKFLDWIYNDSILFIDRKYLIYKQKYCSM